MTSPLERSERRAWLAPLVAVAATLALRLPGHLDSGLWFDEIWTLVDSGRAPLAAVVGSFPGDNHHPFYNLLAWLSLRAFGESAWALRLPALVFGALSVGMLLVYARRVVPAREAYLATALAATSYHHVWFSQNARGYTMLLFLTLAATHLLEDLVAGRGDRRRVVAYAAALALATYTHLTAVFVAAAHLVAAVVRRRAAPADPAARAAPRAVFAGVGLAGVFALLLYAPMARELVTYFWAKAMASAELTTEVAARQPSAYLSAWWTIEATARSLGVGLTGGLVALAAGAVVGLWGAIAHAREALWRLLAWTLPGLLLALAVELLGRSLWPRFFFLLAGFALLVVARGALALALKLAPRRIDRRLAAGVAAAALWLGWTALLPRAYTLPKQDFEGARDYLERTREPGDAIAVVGLAKKPYESYYETDYVAVRDVTELDALARGARRVLVVHTLPDFLRSRRPQLAAELATRGREVARFRGSVGDGDVVVYELAPRDGGRPAP